MDTQQAAPFAQFQMITDYLQAQGVDAEAQAFITGRLMSQVVDRILDETLTLLEPEQFEEIQALPEEQREERLNAVFQEKKGMSLTDFREQVVSEIVQDFERELAQQ